VSAIKEQAAASAGWFIRAIENFLPVNSIVQDARKSDWARHESCLAAIEHACRSIVA